jgi:hypothetical protein
LREQLKGKCIKQKPKIISNYVLFEEMQDWRDLQRSISSLILKILMENA